VSEGRVSEHEKLLRRFPALRLIDPPPVPPRCWIDGVEYELTDEGEWEAVED
jgi:hypothetical protein